MGVKTMKLTIGDRYVNETKGYKEEMEIVGIEADWIVDMELTHGDIFCPNKEDPIRVRVINSFRTDWFHTTVSVKDIANRWNKK